MTAAARKPRRRKPKPPGPGRPPTRGETAGALLRARCTAAEKAIVDAAAEAAGVSTSELLRRGVGLPATPPREPTPAG